MRLNLNIPNDSVAVCLRSPSATVVTRRCGARRAARAAGNLRPQLPTAQQDKTAGRSELPHHPLRYQQECSGSIYRKIDTHNLWPLSSLFRAPGSSISTCKRSHQRNTLPVRLWPGSCSPRVSPDFDSSILNRFNPTRSVIVCPATSQHPVLSKADEYRAQAADCDEQARKVVIPNIRERYAENARWWRELAAQTERQRQQSSVRAPS